MLYVFYFILYICYYILFTKYLILRYILKYTYTHPPPTPHSPLPITQFLSSQETHSKSPLFSFPSCIQTAPFSFSPTPLPIPSFQFPFFLISSLFDLHRSYHLWSIALFSIVNTHPGKNKCALPTLLFSPPITNRPCHTQPIHPKTTRSRSPLKPLCNPKSNPNPNSPSKDPRTQNALCQVRKPHPESKIPFPLSNPGSNFDFQNPRMYSITPSSVEITLRKHAYI